MSEIRPLHIRLLDVTVILVFLGLMRHKKTTIVAEELGVTQPAISHALKRLRTIYDDPLFLRVPHGLEPTAVARELEPLLQGALETLAESLRRPKEFVPAQYAHALRIAGCDFFLEKVLPKLLAKSFEFEIEMPIRTMRLANERMLAALDNDTADLVIGYFSELPDQYRREKLFADKCRLVGRIGHPAVEADATIEFISSHSFIAVTGASSCEQILDDAFAKAGLARDRRAAAPLVQPVFSALRSSDLLAAAPMRIAEAFGPGYGLQSRSLPIETNELEAVAAWHGKNEGNPLIAWLMTIVRSAFEQTNHT
ncbi:MAG: LysR family transcriptional regulator [Albidovulum sp.]|nr:LysR family transcriptional regulator [Albidovulum sp.]